MVHRTTVVAFDKIGNMPKQSYVENIWTTFCTNPTETNKIHLKTQASAC